jgi:ribosome-binding protein aMBF1 (putative translation factor)
MKLSDMIPLDQEIEQARQADHGFRKLWDESSFARDVATRVVAYRAANNFSQAQFGRMLGMTQPAVARLESGDETPTLKTLARVSAATGMEFHVAIAPGGVELAAT